MKYNPNIHHRRSIRLKGYDYSQSGLYFITICCHDNLCRFGRIENGEMILNETGKIAIQCWLEIPQHFPNVILHVYVIMPNHIHGIIEIIENDGIAVGAKNFSPNTEINLQRAKNFSPLQTPQHSTQQTRTTTSNKTEICGTSRTIGSIVRGFKIGVTKLLGYSVWQRNYWENIIRNEKSYKYIENYIINNPVNWGKDKFYTE